MRAVTHTAVRLNPEQAAAVSTGDGPALVLAGPGSGKTRVLTERVAHLVGAGVPPWRILAVTFTNKAAREMRERLQARLGAEAAADLTLGTFHAICARFLRREATPAGIGANFVIYDSADQLRVIKRALEDLNLDPAQNEPRAIHSEISRAKNDLVGPSQYVATSYPQEIVRRVYQRYQELLAAAGALDFDDLLVEVAGVLTRDSAVRRRYRERYLHVLVDEFQDTNLAQYAILRAIAGADEPKAPHNLFAVGDDDQSIYSWRGADYRNVERFRKDFPTVRTYLLERNYRSTQNILDAASAVISRNPRRTAKKLWTETGAGSRIMLFEAHNESEEASFVIHEIEGLVRKGGRLGDVAVMYRTNAQSRAMEDVLVRHRVPYTMVGATRFYDRREVKDVIAYLRVLHNPRDDVALERIINVPARGIGPKALATLREWAAGGSLWNGLERICETEALDSSAATGIARPDSRTAKALSAFFELMTGLSHAAKAAPVPDLLTLVLVKSGYLDAVRDGTPEGDERWENIRELRGVAEDFSDLPPDEALPMMLESVALVADVDELVETPERVTLLTFHSAKGLEFGTVFILGVEEGFLPHSRSKDDPAAVEEERRLFYVGITRARERLVITRAVRRVHHGSTDAREPSRFLADLPSEVLLSAGSAAGAKARPTTRPVTRWEQSPVTPTGPPAESGFRAGDKVRHATFGAGIVVAAGARDGDEEVTVAFEGAGIKKLLASLARLERVR